MKRIFFGFLFLAGCSTRSTLEPLTSHSALEEVRVALLDVRQAFSTQQMELKLLEEKLAKLKPGGQGSTASLDMRIREIEKQLEKIEADLREFGAHANQVTDSLVEYKTKISSLDQQIKQQDARLDEVVKLKTTLNSISTAIGKQSKSLQIHKVIAGDSLEKISRQYETSVDEIKKLNDLTSNTILIGQEIKIPSK